MPPGYDEAVARVTGKPSQKATARSLAMTILDWSSVQNGQADSVISLHEQFTPGRLYRLSEVSLVPYVRVGTFSLVVCPESYSLGCSYVVQDAAGVELAGEHGAQVLVSPLPVFQMVPGCQEVALVVIAGTVSENEVVSQVDGISGPGDKMVDLAGIPYSSIAVETPVRLNLSQ